jgi:cytochrome c553
MKNKISLVLVVIVFIWSCKDNSKETNAYTNVTTIKKVENHPGKKLMEANCYVCHNPTANMDDRIAPPMIAVKMHYLREGVTKKEFIKSIQDFMKNPNTEDAKMYGAVKRFGVMPKANYPEATITQIADYIYDYDIEQPDWIEDHYNQNRGNGNGNGQGPGNGKGQGNGQGKGKMMNNQQTTLDDSNLSFEDRGMKYAMATKAELGKNLMGTIQKKGTAEAIAFCNEAAYPLTDSMSVVYNISIKRVSDKPRNPKNRANSKEKYYINKFKKVIADNQEPNPIVEETPSSVNFYYPIATNTMCLQCHGSTIDSEVSTTIKKLYPNDLAIGYSENEVRGIWSITFDK